MDITLNVGAEAHVQIYEGATDTLTGFAFVTVDRETTFHFEGNLSVGVFRQKQAAVFDQRAGLEFESVIYINEG